VLLEAEERRELLEQGRVLLQIKGANIDQANIASVNDFKKIGEMVDKLAFPENYKPSELPENEFKSKIEKLEKGSKALQRATQIRNFAKINGPGNRIPRKIGRI
jgi:hypothetical protein